MLNQQPLDSTAFPAYVSGGIISLLYKIGTPWAIQDIATLKFTQSADVMSFTHPNYPPYDLARITDTDWTLTETSFEADIAAPPSSASSRPCSRARPRRPRHYRRPMPTW